MLQFFIQRFSPLLSVLGWQQEEEALLIQITSVSQKVSCPDCHVSSARVHSRYYRRIADVPWAGLRVEIQWFVRRFFCDNPECSRRTYAEQLQSMAARYARKTHRLLHLQQQIGFELGGEAGKRIALMTGMPASGDSLLNLVRGAPERTFSTPRFLGVDDWAIRKRHTYGTILVDLELQEPVDLLPDREADTLANWLRAHPGVELVSRDRAQAYSNGILAGAPEAIQVADRFHLLCNLQDAVQRMFEKHPGELREAEKQMVQASAEAKGAIETGSAIPDPMELSPKGPDTWKQIRFAQVKELQKQGQGQRAAAKQLGISRRTINRYFSLDYLPARARASQTTTLAFPFLNYLKKRWEEGQYNRRQLFEEIHRQGFTGSYSSLWRAMTKSPKQNGSGQLQQVVSHWSPRQAAWLLVCQPDKLTSEQEGKKIILCEHSKSAGTAYSLVQRFGQMVREKLPGDLDAWLRDAKESKLPELKRFAVSLQSDYAAVKAALSLPWSNGQVEGQVNRLKLIKRQMYGRASFQLLRRRVLRSSIPP
jgi:transposase